MEQTQRIIHWSDRLSFGIPELDDEHRELALLSNELNGAIDRGVHSSELNALMTLIMERAEAHFIHEEELLTEDQYPLRQGHRLLHEQLRHELKHVANHTSSDAANALWQEYGLLVRQLFEEHFIAETARHKKFIA